MKKNLYCTVWLQSKKQHQFFYFARCIASWLLLGTVETCFRFVLYQQLLIFAVDSFCRSAC